MDEIPLHVLNVSLVAPEGDDLASAALRVNGGYASFARRHGTESPAVFRTLVRLVGAFAMNLTNRVWIAAAVGGAAKASFPAADEERFLQTLIACERLLSRCEGKERASAHAHASASAGSAPAAKPEVEAKASAKVKGTTELVATSGSGSEATHLPALLSPAVFENDGKKLVEKLKLHTRSISERSLCLLLQFFIPIRDRDNVAVDLSRRMPGVPPPPNDFSSDSPDDPSLVRCKKLCETLCDRLVLLQNHQKRAEKTDDPTGPDLAAVLELWRGVLLESGLYESEIPQLPRDTGRRALEASVRQLRSVHMAEGAGSRPEGSQPSRHGSLTADSTTGAMSTGPSSPVRRRISLTDPFASASLSRSKDSRQFNIPPGQPESGYRTYSVATTASERSASIFSPDLSPRETGYSDVTTGISPANTRKASREDNITMQEEAADDGIPLHSFDVLSISTSMTPPPGDSKSSLLMIRKRLDEKTRYLAYFIRDGTDFKMREFPLRWFDRPGAYSKSKKPPSVRLSFLKPKRGSSGESRRPSDDARSPARFSPAKGDASPEKAKMNTDAEGDLATQDEDDASSSLDSVNSDKTTSALIHDQQLAEVLKFLDVEFPREDDCDKFLKIFLQEYDSTTTTETRSTSIPHPAHLVPQRSDGATSASVRAQRATPMGILGLSLTMEQLGLE